MMTFKQRQNHERGGVSIFIVIFTALLVTVVTASFAQLMVRNQQQASANDLSQSAYDSALAGVEDAKRALVKLQECEEDSSDPVCGGIRAALESGDCDSLAKAGVVTFSDGEVQVGGDKELNQAYTCVKVQLDTPSFKDDGVAPGVPLVIPLKSKEVFDKVRISWFTKDDLNDATSNSGVETVSFMPGVNKVLPKSEGGWPERAPALLRAQLIQFKKGSIDLSKFTQKGTQNARTLFLYPEDHNTDDPQSQLFATDARRNNANQNTPRSASCNDGFSEFGGYACQVELTLPLPEDGGTKENREAYLQLQSYYQQYTSFKVELMEGSKVVSMNEVQPKVDSTGRASSLFRRIEANISLRNSGVSLPYPDAALSVGGDLCKNFFITDSSSEYQSYCP